MVYMRTFAFLIDFAHMGYSGGGDYVTQHIRINGQVHTMAVEKKIKRLNREQRKVQIVKSCILIERSGNKPTVHSVAKRMKYSASSLLRNMMNELVLSGILIKKEGKHWNGVTRYTYSVDTQYLKTQHAGFYKQIVKLIGDQLEMF